MPMLNSTGHSTLHDAAWLRVREAASGCSFRYDSDARADLVTPVVPGLIEVRGSANCRLDFLFKTIARQRRGAS
jgi:hypothetical protein